MRQFLGVVAGLCLSFSLALTQSAPQMQWVQTYGDGCTGQYDEILDATQTADGGFAMCGYSQRFTMAHQDLWVLKADSAGNLLWEWAYVYDDPDRGWGGGHAIIETADGDLVVTGAEGRYTQPYEGFLLIRLDRDGHQKWVHRYGGYGLFAFDVKQTPDGGFLLTGEDFNESTEHSDLYVLKTDGSGEILWDNRYNAGARMCGFQLALTADSGFMCIGESRAVGCGNCYSIVIVRADADGDTLWQRVYELPANQRARGLAHMTDGTWIIGGTGSTETDPRNALIARITDAGDLLWSRTVGRADSAEGGGAPVLLVDGILLGGSSEAVGPDFYKDVYLVKTDFNGQEIWHGTYPVWDYTMALTTIALPDGRTILAGSARCYVGSTLASPDGFLMCLGPETPAAVDPVFLHPSAFTLSAAPNPFNPSTRITFDLPVAGRVTLKIYDLTGRLVTTLADEVCAAGLQTRTFDGHDLASGLYFARLQISSHIQTQKLVLLK